ncbi:MAG: GNAT family N-acetyltransferase, partial [Polaromonas sp.]|nr:GNAT family N-acetyltransferase [Polaromonas sp.]
CDPQDFAQNPSATRQGICQVNLDLPETAAGSFGAALVLDFSPQVHPLALFDQLAAVLADDGVVLLLGRQSGRKPPRLAHWLDYAVAIAARCGFAAGEPVDDVSVGGEAFFVRALHRAAAPRWHISHVRPENFAEIATLFQEVFGHPLSRELWEWKYAYGHGNAVAASRQGELVAHYGGMYRDVLRCGEPDWVFQICDVMVHPRERGVLTRQGPFLLTAATSAEIYGPLGFGFPNARAMRVAEKMGLYSEAGQMAEVRWEPASPRARLRSRVRSLASGSAPDRTMVDSLWAAMAHDLRGGVVGVRDWAWLEHRYFGHPHNHYEVLAVSARLSGKPLGLIVLRRLEGSCELLDVIAPLANLAVLIDQARRMTARWGLPYLYCWITKNHLPLLLDCAGREEALNVSIPTSCWTADPRADSFKGKWWLMSGDTDFR